MSKGNARQEAKPQEIEATSPILIDSAALGKKDFLHILHVDDDAGLLELSKQILLMENNFEIENATSVDEAFQKMEQQPYDVIVSDYEMPQKNGLEFLKALREQQLDVPFILFTGKGREDVAVKALNLGADSYINKNGSPETVYCELADAINKTVERKKSRKLLVASESQYRMLVEKSLQGILVTKTAPLRLVFANEAMEKILGYSPQEMLALSPEGILGLVYHEDRAVFFKRMENRLRGEKAEACFEFRAVRKDGSIIWLSALANRVDYDEQPAVLGMFLDVSESKNASEILAESEARYRELANCLPDIVFETDINGQVVFANEGAPKLSGYSQGELEAGVNILQFLVPEDRERAMKSIQRLLSGGSYVPAEYTFVRKDGTTFPALIIATPRFFKNKMVGLRGLAIDITESKKAEEALQESEESFRSLIDSMDDLVFVLGFDGIFKNYHQPSHNKKLYAAPEEFIGQHFLDILPTQVAELCQAAMKRIEDSGETQEFDYYLEMNSEKSWFNARLSPTTDKAGIKTSVTVVVRNISERKKAEEALRISEEKHRIISGISADVTFSCAKKGDVTFFLDWISGACEKIFGYSAKEIEKQGCWKFAVQPEDLPIFEEKITSLKLGQKSMFELRIINKNGSTRWLKVKSIVEEDNENPGGLRLFGACTDITERKNKEFELQLERDKLETVTENIGAGLFLVDKDYKILWTNKMSKHHFGELKSKQCYFAFRNLNDVCPDCGVREIFENGKEIDVREHCFKDTKGDPGWLELTVRPVKDGTGKVVAALELAVPITGRKKAEEALKRSMRDLVLVNEKLHVVGGLARHDVRNKLSTVTGNAFLLKKKHPDQADIISGLGKMEQAVKEIGAIFDFVRMYEQIGVEELTFINVEETLNEALALFSGSLNVKVINDCHGLTLLTDSVLRQLFFNLIDNSLKHGKKATTIKVSYEKADQDRLRLIYEDDGVGVCIDNKLKLFKVGFSTGGSSGYGLYLIRRMIEVYGWVIEENGEPGIGAKFTITIPRINQNGKENFRIAD